MYSLPVIKKPARKNIIGKRLAEADKDEPGVRQCRWGSLRPGINSIEPTAEIENNYRHVLTTSLKLSQKRWVWRSIGCSGMKRSERSHISITFCDAPARQIDVANKLVSMFLHELSRKISRKIGQSKIGGEEYEQLVRDRFNNQCPVLVLNQLGGHVSVIEHLDGMNRYRAGLHTPGNGFGGLQNSVIVKSAGTIR